MEVTERVSKASAPLPPTITAGLSSHSLRRGSAAYANASPKLAIQWISTRGAWLLDSLTKAFAYAGTTTREDQSVGKVLAGYNDPHLPCATPSIRTLQEVLPALEYAQLLSLKTQLFRTVSGFTDVTLNVDTLVLDAVMASPLIHLEEISAAVAKEQASSGYTSHYLYRFHVALDTTNTALGAEQTLATCIGSGHQLRAAWETENFAQLGGNCGGDTAVLASAVTQMLSSIAAMQRTLGKLVTMQEKRDAQAEQAQAPSESSAPSVLVTTDNSSSSVEAHTLAGCFYNWYVLQLWHTATNKKQQFVRADLKACINIMLIASGTHISIPAQPLDRDGVSYRL
ncbi:hypothetical protein PF010_g24647 [Phytophthora fragariae]|uniref:Uncharacterized protein n=2 Tax=Phytophthora fragariae TaxID=53985 RepID=A0A6G0K1X4_9STRA|nr:hypothetical protein PF010_g24647 [Phytophthora fragariae]